MILFLFEPELAGHHETLLRQYTRILCGENLRIRLLCGDADLFNKEDWAGTAIETGRLSLRRLPSGWGRKSGYPMILRLLLSSLTDFRHWLILRGELRRTLRLNPGTGVSVYFMFLGSKPFFPSFFWRWCVPVPWAALCGQAWRFPLKFRNTGPGRFWEWIGMCGPRTELCRKVFYWSGEPERFLETNVGPGKMELITDSTDLALPETVPSSLLSLQSSLADRFVICLVGGVVPRKGVRAFLEAAQRMRELPVAFVIAGQVDWAAFDEATAATLRTASEQPSGEVPTLIVIDRRFQSEEDLNWIIRRSGLCYLAYVGFDGSSNILSKAAAFRVPVIVSEGTVLAESCRRHRLGWVVPPDDASAVVRAIEDARTELPENRTTRDFEAHAELHSEARLAAQLRAMIATLRNSSPPGGTRTEPSGEGTDHGSGPVESHAGLSAKP